jgi:hypothetical protein
MLRRSIENILETALKISPIVLLKGARQVESLFYTNFNWCDGNHTLWFVKKIF